MKYLNDLGPVFLELAEGRSPVFEDGRMRSSTISMKIHNDSSMSFLMRFDT